MPIPRNIGKSNEKPNNASSDPIENNLRQSDQSGIQNTLQRRKKIIESKGELEEAFSKEESLPPMAEALSSNEVQNLDEKELDQLLGIDDDFNSKNSNESFDSSLNNEHNINEDTINFDEELPDLNLENLDNHSESISEENEDDIIILQDSHEDLNEKPSSENDRISDMENEISLLLGEDFDDDDNNEDSSDPIIENENNDKLDEDEESLADIDFDALLAGTNDKNQTESLKNSDSEDNSDLEDDDFEILFDEDSKEYETVDENSSDEDDLQEDETIYDDLLKELNSTNFDDDDEDSESEEEFSFEDNENDWGFSDNKEELSEKEDDAFSPIINDEDKNESDIEEEDLSYQIEDEDENEDLTDEKDKPFDFYSEEDEITNDNDNEEKEKKPKKKKKNSGSFAEKFSHLKNQVMADIKGEDSLSQAQKDDEDDDNEEEQKDRKQKKNKSKNTPAILNIIKKPYMFIVSLFFSLINFILGVLSKLPIIGKVFKIALSASKVIEKIALFMPIVLIVAIFAMISYFQVPRESESLLPDNGSAVFQEFKYDSKSQKASGVIVNNGEVILEIKPKFEVYAIVPDWKPTTWFMPVKVGECSAKELVEVDIDSSKKTTVNCESSKGFVKRASGVIK